jgi:glycosyltransferase involved in cell wall biosynthesis
MKIEFMWFITPVYLPVDMPYLTIVLDLQHRLQPWFPEVGLDAEWQGRESYFKDFLRRATYILVGTETGREELSFFYQIPKDRIRILPHPTPNFTSNDLENDVSIIKKYNLPKNFLFYPAQFWAHKNHVNILHAIKYLKDNYKLHLPAVFVGSDMGNLSHVKQYVEKLGLEEQVYFLGFVSRNELIELYRNAFALVYMSFFGPENLPPLEAFSLGCPVIASKVQGAEEQLGDAALLVNPNKPEELADIVKRLWDDPILRDSLIKKGISRAPKWTGEDFVTKVFSILDEFEVIRRCWPA